MNPPPTEQAKVEKIHHNASFEILSTHATPEQAVQILAKHFPTPNAAIELLKVKRLVEWCQHSGFPSFTVSQEALAELQAFLQPHGEENRGTTQGVSKAIAELAESQDSTPPSESVCPECNILGKNQCSEHSGEVPAGKRVEEKGGKPVCERCGNSFGEYGFQDNCPTCNHIRGWPAEKPTNTFTKPPAQPQETLEEIVTTPDAYTALHRENKCLREALVVAAIYLDAARMFLCAEEIRNLALTPSQPEKAGDK